MVREFTRRLKKTNMRFNFKKVSAIGASVLMAGMSVGVAAAANYPAPFLAGSTADVAIVYGTGEGVSALDQTEAFNLNFDLTSRGGSSSDTSTSIGGSGAAASLASGSDLLYLNDDLGENVQTLTKDDLPAVLADGKFTDDGGTGFDYEQTITVGQSSTNNFAFGNSDSDLDDPALMLELGTADSAAIYNWSVVFDTAVNLTDAESEGEPIELFGKMYTVGTATDDNTLVLLGGADSTKVNVGEAATLTLDSMDYAVSLDGLSSDATTKAGITVNGMYKTFTEGQTKTFALSTGDVDVYAKTVFRTGDSGEGYVEIELGADKLTFEHGDNVKYGADNDDIEGSLVYFLPADDTGLQAVTELKVAIFAEDDDLNHVLAGESFTDPVFKSLSLDFSSAANGPMFEAEMDPATVAGRTMLKVKKGGDRELQLEITDKGGNSNTLPFTYQDILRDDNSDRIVLEEGAILEKDDYFILNSGDYQHFMEITKLSIDEDDVADDDITFKDLLTGTSHTIIDKNLGATINSTTITINSQTYTVWSMNASWINVSSSDVATNRAIYPYIELVSGKDTRAAMVDTIVLSGGSNFANTTANSTAGTSLIYELPTGSIQFRTVDANISTVDPVGLVYSYQLNGAGSWTTLGNGAIGANTTSITIGAAEWIFGLAYRDVLNSAWVDVDNVTFDYGFDSADADDGLISPGILLVEEEDKSEATSDIKNVVLINTTDSSTYSQVNSIKFSGTSDTQAWDDTDYTGYLTNFGTYALLDAKDDNQKFASIVYPSAHMYAEVFFSEEGAVITAGSAGGATVGNVVVKDSEVSSVAANNLVVIGGSCINSAAATLVGAAHCGASWTEATGVGSGEFLIKGYSDSALAPGKLAVLVAGYSAADTVNAATYLRTQTVDTDKEYKGTSSTSAELVVAA